MMTCRISSRDKACDALMDVMKERGLVLKTKEKVNEITGNENQFEVSAPKNGWVLVFCPETSDDKIASSLSKILNAPVFQFHIHAGTFWMYQLFVSGKLKDRHNPLPDYWKKLSEKEKKTWKGNSSVLASIFGIQKSKVEPYLEFWNENKADDHKAFSDDAFPIMSEWSMVDFQRKLGIRYPDFENPGSLDLIRLTLKKKK